MIAALRANTASGYAGRRIAFMEVGPGRLSR